ILCIDRQSHVAAFHGGHYATHVIDGLHDVVEHLIHTFNDHLVFALITAGVGAHAELATRSGACQVRRFGTHGLDSGHGLVQRGKHQTELVTASAVDGDVESTGGDVVGDLHRLGYRAGDAAGDQPARQYRQQQCSATECHQKGLCVRDGCFRLAAGGIHLFRLVLHQCLDRVEVHDLRATQVCGDECAK